MYYKNYIISSFIIVNFMILLNSFYKQNSYEIEYHYNTKDSLSTDSLVKIIFPFIVKNEGYFKLNNKVGENILLKDYNNYENKNDTIIIEKIIYAYKKNNFYLLTGIIMGSRYSLVVCLKQTNNKLKVIYTEEFSYCSDFMKKRFGNDILYSMTTSNITNCEQQQGYILFSLNSRMMFNKVYEGLKNDKFYPANNNPPCIGGISYKQTFKLENKGDSIILEAIKKSDSSEITKRNYLLSGNKFIEYK